MERRGIWRQLPDDPRTLAGYISEDRDRILKRPLRGLGCLVKAGMLYLLFKGQFYAAAGCFAILTLIPLLKRKHKTVDPLLTVPLPAPTFPCSVEILREDTVIGLDRGIVTFLDGWLHFEGYRTSFSLSGSDAIQHKDGHLSFRHRSGVAFYPEDRLESGGLTESDLKERFKKTLERWFRAKDPPQGISVLPPLTLHRSGIARAWIGLGASAVNLSLTFALLWAIYTYTSNGLIFFAFFFTGSILDGIRDFQKVRRFAREERRTLPNLSPPPIGP